MFVTYLKLVPVTLSHFCEENGSHVLSFYYYTVCNTNSYKLIWKRTFYILVKFYALVLFIHLIAITIAVIVCAFNACFNFKFFISLCHINLMLVPVMWLLPVHKIHTCIHVHTCMHIYTCCACMCTDIMCECMHVYMCVWMWLMVLKFYKMCSQEANVCSFIPVLPILLVHSVQYSITLLPSVNTLIAWGMFCGAIYTHHIYSNHKTFNYNNSK